MWESVEHTLRIGISWFFSPVFNRVERFLITNKQWVQRYFNLSISVPTIKRWSTVEYQSGKPVCYTSSNILVFFAFLLVIITPRHFIIATEELLVYNLEVSWRLCWIDVLFWQHFALLVFLLGIKNCWDVSLMIIILLPFISISLITSSLLAALLFLVFFLNILLS